jgi:2-keto-3-deoxy-L-rhamnonate aldolase RhmA
MGIPSADLAALAISAGYSSVILDCEHGFPMDSVIRVVLPAVHNAGGRCLLRLTMAAIHQTAYFADIGVDGFVLSGPQELREIEAILDRVHFAPDGVRSVNPFVDAAGEPGDITRLHKSSEDVQVWAMAENSKFIESMDMETSSRVGESRPWAGLIIGPYDLASDLGCKPDPGDPDLQLAVRRYVRAAEQVGLEWGLFVRDRETLRKWQSLDLDPRYVVMGYDRDAWFQECRRRVWDVLEESQPDE